MRWLRAALLLSLIAALLFGGAAWLAGSEWAVRTLARALTELSEGRIAVEGASGSLYGPLRIERLTLQDAQRRIELSGVVLDWQPRALWRRHLHISRLHASRLAMHQLAPSIEPLRPPRSLDLPLALSVDDVHIAALHIAATGFKLDLAETSLTLHKPGRRYRLALERLDMPWGRVSGALGLDARAPFALEAKLGLTAHAGQTLQATAEGRLERFRLRAHAEGVQPLALTAEVMPFAELPLQAARLEAKGLDPALWHMGWPQARLDVDARFSASREGWATGRMALNNRQPGPLDRGLIPLTGLSSLFDLDRSGLRLSALLLDLGAGGRLTGEARWADGRGRVALNTRDLDPNQLMSRLRPMRLAGHIVVDLDRQGQGIDLALTHRRHALQLQARRQADRLTVSLARLRSGPGGLELSGQVGLSPPYAFKAQGRLSAFDPAAFGDFPHAQLNGRFDGEGRLQPKPEGSLAFALTASRWRGHPVAGGGRLRLAAGRQSEADIDLDLAGNRLQLKGAYGRPDDVLQGHIDARQLSRLDPRLGGRVQGDGRLLGTLGRGSLQLDLTADGLRWADALAVRALTLQARLAAGLNGRLDLHAALEGVRAGGQGLDRLTLAAEGSRAQHSIRLEARGGGFSAQGVLAGGWREDWSGRLLSLEAGPRPSLRLLAPAELSWSTRGFSLTQADFALDEARLRLDTLSWLQGRWHSRGRLHNLAPSSLPGVALHLADWDQGLRLAASWDLAHAAGPSGQLRLWREAGDLAAPTDPRLPLGLKRLELDIDASESVLRARLDVQGDQLGGGRADVMLQRDAAAEGRVWSAASPVEAQAQLELPDLAWLGPLLTPEGGLTLQGRARLQMAARGRLRAPELSGELRAQGLRLDWPEQGVALRDGTLLAGLEREHLRLQSLRLRGPEGSLQAQGSLSLTQGLPRLDLTVTADKLRVLDLPERRLTVSGAARLTGQGRDLRVGGRFEADQARILLPREDAPAVSADVVVLGRALPPRRRPPRPILLDLELGLGPRFYLQGRGLDVRLAGTLRLKTGPDASPHLSGSVRVAQGSYSAYGRRLTIERGILDFQGPIDNPGLDIVAVRTGLPVEAGVAVGGTALAPQARLVSRPEVPDSEKLSWLLLGRGLEAGQPADLQLLSLAADAMLSAGQSVSLQAQLAEATGLDEIGLRGVGTLEGSMLTLGKRLSDRAYLNYERGLTGLEQLVRLTYRLSRRWSLKAQTGRENTLDLMYTVEFD